MLIPFCGSTTYEGLLHLSRTRGCLLACKATYAAGLAAVGAPLRT